jgi:DNA polymerase II large subunit
MDEYISRKKAVDACFDGWNNTPHDCAENIRQIPAADVRQVVTCADVRPVVRGKWEYISLMTVKCSNCQETFRELEWDNFCPHCGADMREKPAE